MSGGTILVVDDASITTDVLKGILTAEGYKVLVADSKAQALEVYEKNRNIDLLFTDCKMEDHFSGIELISELRRKGFARPAILQTSNSDAETQRQLKALPGDNSFLLKGYERKELLDLIRSKLDQSPTR